MMYYIYMEEVTSQHLVSPETMPVTDIYFNQCVAAKSLEEETFPRLVSPATIPLTPTVPGMSGALQVAHCV